MAVFRGRTIEGAVTLLDELAARPHAALGLLTGNIAGGAASKVRHYGLAAYFAFGAYGCDDADRNRLGPVALDRATTHTGRGFTPRETWIIGDTPKDIACARAIGARCLAVATGRFSRGRARSLRAGPRGGIAGPGGGLDLTTEDRMKVAIVHYHAGPGGVMEVIRTTSRGLADSGRAPCRSHRWVARSRIARAAARHGGWIGIRRRWPGCR